MGANFAFGLTEWKRFGTLNIGAPSPGAIRRLWRKEKKMGTNKLIDDNLLPESVRDLVASMDPGEQGRFWGIGFTGRKTYDCPKYDVTPDEKVIAKGNSSLVLGYDRPHSRGSGFGGKGATQCSSMDLVVGRLGYQAKSEDSLGRDDLRCPHRKFDLLCRHGMRAIQAACHVD